MIRLRAAKNPVKARGVRQVSTTAFRSALIAVVGTFICSLLGAPGAASADHVVCGKNVYGEIDKAFQNTGGQSKWGCPTTNEAAAGPYRGVNGRFQNFQNSASFYWHQSLSPAHEIGGSIRDKWGNLNYERGILGYPVTDESAATGGRFNHFSGGSIYYSSATGAHQIGGAIQAKYESMGWERSYLGFPTTDELSTAAGKYNFFQGGAIYWSSDTAAHPIHGAILDIWKSRNYESGYYGYPVSDEYDYNGGKAQDFESGTIDWQPGDPATPPADVADPANVSRADANYNGDTNARQARPAPAPSSPAPTSTDPSVTVPPTSTPDLTTPAAPSTKSTAPTSGYTSSAPSIAPALDTRDIHAPKTRIELVNQHGDDGDGNGASDDPDPNDELQLTMAPCGIVMTQVPHASQQKDPNNPSLLLWPGEIHTRIISNCSIHPPIYHKVEAKTARLRYWGWPIVQPQLLPDQNGAGKVLSESGTKVTITGSQKKITMISAIACQPGTKFRYATISKGEWHWPDGEQDVQQVSWTNPKGKEKLCLSND